MTGSTWHRGSPGGLRHIGPRLLRRSVDRYLGLVVVLCMEIYLLANARGGRQYGRLEADRRAHHRTQLFVEAMEVGRDLGEIGTHSVIRRI